jgi:2-polyprenyl-3-methyl-5-hydroxy-6-metoxy-1,4-benzoquinol methylase
MASNEQVEFYNNFVPHFEANITNIRNKTFRQWLLKWVHPTEGIPPRVLDFGCALGYNSGFLAAQGVNVTGIDISPACIEKAKEMWPAGTWHCGDVLDGYSLPDDRYDWIIMSDVIEHVPADKRVSLFSLLSSKTAGDGAVIASIPNPELHEEILKSATKQPIEEKVEILDLLKELAEAGFNRVVTLFIFGGVYYRLIVQKGR